MPSAWASVTVLVASAVPWARAHWYSPSVPRFGLILGSSWYLGKRGWQDACGPRVIGSSRQPLASWVLIHAGVRFGWSRQARELPEM